MFLVFLTFITAVSISAVAIYYSVAGLMAIFAAAAIPIAIMGTVLEVGKLVTAVWLHHYWNETVWWLKTYLVAAVIVLMFITSMGIFGFLSRAHIEQTSNASGVTQIIEQYDSEIERLESAIERAEAAIVSIENRSVSQTELLQSQIDQEQDRIDAVLRRIQPDIDRLNEDIRRQETRGAESFINQLETLDDTVRTLDLAVAENDVRRIQSIVGVQVDGIFGPNTERALTDFRTNQETQRAELVTLIENIQSQPNPVIEESRQELARIRSVAEQEISDSNALISRLRSQLGQDQTETMSDLISEQETIIANAQRELSGIRNDKFELEVDLRMLEAEVGPIKYIAEFVYGSSDSDILEEAVRWVIIIIIFVFDPLAVLLLIASQKAYQITRNKTPELINKNDLLDFSNVFDSSAKSFKSKIRRFEN